MDVFDPDGLELGRGRRAELLRETESYRLACRLQTPLRVSGGAA
jgi:hypothetical protein